MNAGPHERSDMRSVPARTLNPDFAKLTRATQEWAEEKTQ